MATKAEKAVWAKEAVEAFNQTKSFMITKGGTSVSKHIIRNMLEIEDFPSESDAIHPIEEEKLLKAIFFAHAHAVDSIFNTIIRMVEDGVLEPNGNMANKVAEKLRQENEIDEDDDEDGDE
jgi:hypothetical protein